MQLIAKLEEQKAKFFVLILLLSKKLQNFKEEKNERKSKMV